MSETQTQEAAETAPKAAGRRGRPRPQETMNRDDEVLKVLEDGPKTRDDIAKALGVKKEAAYLSLFRLSRATPARVVREQRLWKLAPPE